MKRRLTLIAVVAVLASMLALPTAAEEHDDFQFPEHGHMLVQRPVIGIVTVDGVDFEAAIGFRKCVDLAGGRALHLGAHHERVHFGQAGRALEERAGHAVVPTAPLTPWDDCAALEEALPILFGPA
jgi:hypothetical protein